MQLLFRVYQECEDTTLSHMVVDKITIARIIQEHIRGSKEQQQGRYPYHTSDSSEYYIMQYTGVDDYNGVKIYEGDLLDFRGCTFLVEFKYGQFMATRERLDNVNEKVKDMNDLWNFVDGGKVTIIGNIHENPDLLKTI